jgi:mono/diheme cytochrome c family protein
MMRISLRGMLAGAVAMAVLGLGIPTGAGAASKAAIAAGKKSYMQYCATCHGPTATGDGVAASTFQNKPPDLTLLAQKNGGKFPTAEVLNIVKGNTSISAHGTKEMPVWGQILGHPLKGEYGSSRADAKLLEIANYLQTIQKK